MGLIDMDDVASFAIGKAEDKLQGEERKEKTTFGGAILRFFVSIIWFVIAAAATFGGAAAMVGGDFNRIFGGGGSGLYVIGIGVCLAVFILTMLIPFLRKKGSFTRWCGIVCLGDALWWIYLLISGH